MTNEQEVLELAKKCGAMVDCDELTDNVPIINFDASELLAFAQSIRDQEAAKRIQLEAQIAMLVDTLEKLSHLGMNDMHPYKQMIDSSLSATAPEAESFIREKQAVAIRKATIRIVCELEGLAREQAINQIYRTSESICAELRNAKEV